MELFIVIDKAILGRGVFGVFSSLEKARSFSEHLFQSTHFPSEVRQCVLVGTGPSDAVYAAHSYDNFYDTYVFDGVYSESTLAYEAVGDKGLIIEFPIDSPDEKKIVG